MVMGEAADAVDLLIIGGGPGGYTAALHAAALGRQVTLVDRDGIGGVCLHRGCIPSKALIEMADGHDHRQKPLLSSAGPTVPDLAEWQAQKAHLVGHLGASVSSQLERASVDRISGQARFTGRGRVAVQSADRNTRFLEFRHAIIATGSSPGLLATLPVDGERVLDSTGVLALDAVPKRLVVVGAGYIGVELATALAKLGAEVTLVEREAQLLPGMPPFLMRPVAKRLAQLGVTVRLETSVQGLDDDGLRVRGGTTEETVVADKILVAVGRRPNTDTLGLDVARVAVDESGRIRVSPDRTIPGTAIAAIGDVTPGPMLAHKATAEAVVAADALCGRTTAFDPAAIPLVVFSDPEIASAGLTETDARAQGMTAAAAAVPLAGRGRGAPLGLTDGLVQVVADTDRDVIVGLHIAAPHASELIAAGVLAIEMAASPGDLAAAIFPHPTLSEAVQEAARRLCQAR